MAVDSFFQGRKVAVTGITGFKGRWLAAWLEKLGADVCGFGLPPEDDESLRFWNALNGSYTWGFLDIRHAGEVNAFLQSQQPEIVFHLAAQPLVRLSYREPVETLAVNVMGTVHLLEAVRQLPSVKVVVNVTSDKCYENREWPWGYRESEPMGGHDPYSVSKGCSELVTSAWRRSFLKQAGIQVATARAGNVIGGGDWAADRIIPDIVRGVLADRSIEIRHPAAVRPWQHVLEPLSGYLLLAERLGTAGDEFADGWNFGPSDADPVTVGELAMLTVESFGRGQLKLATENSGLHEATSLRLDSSRARQRLGWRAMLSTQARAEWTVQWYQSASHPDCDLKGITLEQIERYEQEMRTCPAMRKSWYAESPASSDRQLRAA